MKLITRILKISLLAIGALILLIVLLFGHRDISLKDLKAKYSNEYSSFISVEGMNVHYRDEGDALDSIPMVLIHGTGSSLQTFDEWTTQLKRSHRVVRMDLPAYGLTGPFPDRNYSINHYVEFIKDFLTSLGIEKCVLAGNSLGGHIAWSFTTTYPDMVDRLILIDASGYPNKAKSVPIAFKMAQVPVIKNMFTYITPRFVVKASVENVYADKSKVTEQLVDRYFELSLREGNRQAFVDRLKEINDTSSYHIIKSIQQKTLILWGTEDRLIPIESAHRFHEDLPNDTLVIINGIGHVPMEESPKESLIPVNAFLKR